MITTEEIAVKVYQMLKDAVTSGSLTTDGEIDYERTDYEHEGIIIVPHTIDGEGSVRFGQVNVNIHVPDLANAGDRSVYRINKIRLIELRSAVIDILKRHFELGTGYNWKIGLLNPAIKEQNHNEHFFSMALEITVREIKNNS